MMININVGIDDFGKAKVLVPSLQTISNIQLARLITELESIKFIFMSENIRRGQFGK